MGADGLREIRCAPIMEKEESLARSPKRRGPELVRPGVALPDSVGEPGAHVV